MKTATMTLLDKNKRIKELEEIINENSIFVHCIGDYNPESGKCLNNDLAGEWLHECIFCKKIYDYRKKYNWSRKYFW